MKTEDIKKMGLAFQQVQEKSKKKLDPVDKDELKGTHADRDDKDIDNDGDEDDTDKFLHKKRKAISKAMDEGDSQSADKKPEDYIDPNDGKKRTRMVPVDKEIIKKESTGWKIFDRIQEKAKVEEEPDENKKMALQKALQRASRTTAKGKAAVTLAPGDPTKKKMKENDQVVLDDDEVNVKKKKNQETAKMNPKISDKEKTQVESNQKLEMHTDYVRPNAVSKIKEAMLQMWQEASDRAAHYKGATKPEDMKDNRKGKGAQDMMKAADDAIANPEDVLPKAFDDVSKAGRAGPSKKNRPNDRKEGDKNIIKGGTK